MAQNLLSEPCPRSHVSLQKPCELGFTGSMLNEDTEAQRDRVLAVGALPGSGRVGVTVPCLMTTIPMFLLRCNVGRHRQ